jgi:hypothetical protein
MTRENLTYCAFLAITLLLIFGPVVLACFIGRENPYLGL